MKYVVAKEFNTHLQRWKVGAPISETDRLEPFDFQGLEDRKFIAREGAKAPEADAPSPPPDPPPGRAPGKRPS